MPQIYDMGPTAFLPLRRKACWGFFRPKSLTALAGFEPTNLGIKGQHATPRPPKPLMFICNRIYLISHSLSFYTSSTNNRNQMPHKLSAERELHYHQISFHHCLDIGNVWLTGYWMWMVNNIYLCLCVQIVSFFTRLTTSCHHAWYSQYCCNFTTGGDEGTTGEIGKIIRWQNSICLISQFSK